MVGGAGGAKGWVALAAAVLHVGAPGSEPAALGWVDQVWRSPGDGMEPGPAGIGKTGDRVHQRLGVGHVGVVEQGVGGGALHDPPGVHDHDLIGPAGHHPQVVGDQDDRHVTLPLQFGQQIEDLGLHGHVEAGGRLVGHHQARRTGQGDGDHHALAHPARELEGVPADALLGRGDAHLAQELDGVGVGLGAIHVQVQAERLGDLSPDPLHRVEGGHRVLEDHAQLGAPHLAELGRFHGGQVVAGEVDGPAPDDVPQREEAHDRPGQHRLARSRLTHDPQGLAPVHGEGDAVDRPDGAPPGAERGMEVLDLQQGPVGLTDIGELERLGSVPEPRTPHHRHLTGDPRGCRTAGGGGRR